MDRPRVFPSYPDIHHCRMYSSGGTERPTSAIDSCADAAAEVVEETTIVATSAAVSLAVCEWEATVVVAIVMAIFRDVGGSAAV